MKLPFIKVHGLGNDFVLIDGRAGEVDLAAREVVHICDRRLGVGADGVLTVLQHTGEAPFAMRVQNADGSDAGMCGNGLRCVARFLFEAGAVAPSENAVNIAAGHGVYRCTRLGADRFAVAMGRPREVDPSLPPASRGVDEIDLEVEGESVHGTRLSFGNPHLVSFDPAPPRPRAERLGAALERHPAFPERVNVSFARPAPGGFEVVVWERGVGITRACGSGACAVAAAAVRRGRAAPNEAQRVELPGGVLVITVDDAGAVTMEGEAAYVFAGEWAR